VRLRLLNGHFRELDRNILLLLEPDSRQL
jgi:hypothetical protein